MYAQIYAQRNGLSVDDAKLQLKTQYGEPQQVNTFGFQFGVNNQTVKASSLNDPEFEVDSNFSIEGLFQNLINKLQGNNGPQKEGDPQLPGMDNKNSYKTNPNVDPDTYAQQYANENGLTLDEAKTELQSKYGVPQQPNLFLNM